jgi:5-methylcytosine-specific restriction enzyme subunit McrC
MPSVFRAREREATSIPIQDVFRDGEIDILPQVQGREYFDVRFQGDKLRVTAGKYVGLIPLNERVYIDVEPKVPVANLMAILSAIGGELIELGAIEREYRTIPDLAAPVLEAVARAFVLALRKIEISGIRKRYQPTVQAGPTLKGRIDFGDSAQRFWSRGTRHQAVCSYFALNANLLENRLLRFALYVLLAQHRATGSLSRSVNALAHFDELLRLAGVSLERVAPATIPFSLGVGQAPEFARALRLARLIVSGEGVDMPIGGLDVALPSFVVNMESVFERYVRHVVERQFPDLKVLDGNLAGAKSLFDDRRMPLANPDVVVLHPSGEYGLVLEVKYKTAEHREDLNQVLAYALSYRIPRIVVVLPADGSATGGLSTIGEVSNIRVLRYRLNLAAADLQREELDLGAALRPLLTQSIMSAS